MFKKTVYFLAAACLMVCGCTKSRTEIADVLVLSRAEVAFSQAGGNAIIGVGCPSTWTAECNEDWVSVTPSANAVAISVPTNASSQKRIAKVQISAGNAAAAKVLTIVQSANMGVTIINAPELITLDSEVDSVYFSVDATAAWTVSSEAEWLSVSKDEKTGVVEVKCVPNEGEEDRVASVTVNKAGGESTSVTVSQICRANNPYFNYIGSYDLYAENWYLEGSAIGAPGIGTGCTIEAKEYGKSFIIKDLFYDGTVNEATYDKVEGTLSIMTGRSCLEMNHADGSFTIFYLAQTDFAANTLETNNVVCQLGTGYDEATDPDHTKPLKVLNVIRGIEDDCSFGLVGYFSANQAYGYFRDRYYAAGEMYFIARSE